LILSFFQTWNHLKSIINHQSSIINHQSSIINHQPSTINQSINQSIVGPKGETKRGF